MHSSPLFSNSEIYLYQKYKSKDMRVFSRLVGRKCLLVFATYEEVD